LEVHHKIPVSVDPSRELDETNLITLCMYPTQKDHFHVGHLGNWKDYNRNVVKDAAFMLSRHHATRKHPPCLM
jgi:5-methylcytosine-specific restriction endonuclease McrA